MKKTSLKEYFREIISGFREVIKKYPVEMGLACILFIASVLYYKSVWEDFTDIWVVLPLFFTLSYILNKVCRCRPVRWIYYVCWLPVIGLAFFDLTEWLDRATYWVAFGSLLMAVPVFKGRRDNTGFAAENWWFFSAVITSLLLALVASLLFMGLVLATIKLFNLDCDGEDLIVYFGIFSFTVGFALLALSYLDRHEGTLPEKTGIMSVLLYYIVTPALLAFNALFYAYLLKIIFTWSLPEGYISIMVFSFALSAYLVKVLRELLPVKRYGWYFDNLSFIALPAVILFWIGVVYRITEYGFTESRVYLVISGAVMCVALGLLVCKNRGNYRTAWITAIVLFGLFTFIKPISGASIGLCSQERRLVRLATQLDLLDSLGNLKTDILISEDDAEAMDKLREMREALIYLKYNNGPDYGIEYAYSYGSDIIYGGRYGRGYIYSNVNPGLIKTAGISYAIMVEAPYYDPDYKYEEEDGFLRIYHGPEAETLPATLPLTQQRVKNDYTLIWEKPLEEIRNYLLESAGITHGDLSNDDFNPSREQEKKLTLYEDAHVKILFPQIYIYPDGNYSTISLPPNFTLFVKE